jgi:hypothetical protein
VSDENANLPKCVNCRKLNCDAGKVNHRTEGKERGPCMLCDCTKFKEVKGSR